MRVLGIDPGLARTGLALVDGGVGALSLLHTECLETVPQTNEAARLANLLELVSEACSVLRPDVGAVEEIFFSSNRRTAMRVSEARGVVLCALARANVPVAEYTPTQVKQAVCGYGGARKPQVARMVVQLLQLSEAPTPDDVADACAVAVCHHHRANLTSLVGRRRVSNGRLDLAIARARERVQRAMR